MSSENAKPDQIQASVAAALSRLRGDLDPAGTQHGTSARNEPGRAEIGRPANDLRADPFFQSIQSAPRPQGPQAGVASATRGPIPMTPFARTQASHEAPADPVPPDTPTQSPEANAMPEPEMAESAMPEQPPMPEQPAMPERSLAPDLVAMPEPAPTTSGAPAAEPPTAAPAGPASPLSRIMRGAGTQQSGPSQRDLLADLPPPPIGEPLSTDPEASAMRRRRRNRLLLGGAVAVIVIAVGAWLWGGGEQSTDVPVITAEATPEKVKPADEGGLQVPNQNVQVLENMDGAGGQPEVETVLPPPEQPVAPPTPSAGEAPTVVEGNAAEGSTAEGANAPAAQAPAAETSSEQVPAAPAVTAPEPGQGEGQTTAAAPTDQKTAPAADDATQPAQPPAAPDVTMDQPLPPAGAEAATEPTPVPEQGTPEQQAPAQTATETTNQAAKPEPTATQQPAATQEAAVAPTGGNSRVQLAAGKSEDAVKKEWARLQKAYPDLLGSLSLTMQRVDKGSAGIFYRLQAGPLADANAAKQLCASLKQHNQDCIVAK